MAFSLLLEGMKGKKYWLLTGSLVVLVVAIRVFSSNSLWVEYYYSRGIYPCIAVSLRYALGWLPFSVGDILYGMIVIWLLANVWKAIKLIYKRQLILKSLIPAGKGILGMLLLIYIVFNLLWGINYNRKGIASQLGLSMEEYSVHELKMLNAVLLQKVNASNFIVLQNHSLMSSNDIYRQSELAYEQVNKQYSFLNYHPASIKTSLWGWLGNYVGFLGYYNPFTGEGQVNTNVPAFLQPYISCHEIAHQIGYAKENEANFVGYLAASSSTDADFHYSVYLDLFMYANRNLYRTDSASAKAFSRELHPAVKKDVLEWRKFIMRHENPVEPVIRWMYGKYLESNQQPSGMLSYDEVTGFMIAYYKKFGKL